VIDRSTAERSIIASDSREIDRSVRQQAAVYPTATTRSSYRLTATADTLTIARKTKAAIAQELADVVNNILDQDDDDPIPLAFAKMKVVNVEMVANSTSAYVERMVFDEEDGFETDGTTPKYKAPLPSTRLRTYQMGTRHSSRSLLLMSSMRKR
jgi:hypothetical protein